MLTLETKNLRLRQVEEQDYSLFKTLLQNQSYTRYLPDSKVFKNDNVRTFIKRRKRHWLKGYGTFVITLKDKPLQTIGFVGVEVSPNPLYSDLRFMILTRYQGKGFAFEASSACLKHVFNSGLLAQIYGVCMEKNLASLCVFKKLGLTPENRKRLYPDKRGEFKVYTLSRKNFKCIHNK